MDTSIQFVVTKDKQQYVAEGVGVGIVTQAGTLEDLMANIREAVDLFFSQEAPHHS